MQLELFHPDDSIRCEIRRKTFRDATWYMIDVTVNDEPFYTAFHDNLADARADSERIRALVT
jgi:hypothetical protein